MGVKFNREYEEIVEDLTKALFTVEDFYTFFDMSLEDWNALDEEEQTECARTLADDLFYALGANPEAEIGSAKLQYDAQNHIIKLISSPGLVRVIYLI
jgi:hypothetical protein